MKTYKLIALSISTLVLISCGGGGGGTDSNTDPVDGETGGSTNGPTREQMQVNKTYQIQRGETIEKKSQNAKLNIHANMDTEVTTVTLLSGEAEIVK